MIISQLELGLPVVKQDWFQVSHSIRHEQKTHMLVKTDFKCRTLFGTLRKHTCQVRLLQVSHFIRHNQKTHVKQDWLLSLTLYSARTEPHMSCKIEGKSCTLFGTHRKRNCRVRLTITLVLHSAHTHKTHILSKVDFKSHTLSGTHRKFTCRVSLTTTLVLHTAHAKHTYRVRLTTILVLYSVCTETHKESKIASSLALYSKRTETHVSSKTLSWSWYRNCVSRFMASLVKNN